MKSCTRAAGLKIFIEVFRSTLLYIAMLAWIKFVPKSIDKAISFINVLLNFPCCTLFLFNIVSHLAKETPAFFAYQINFCNRAEPVRPHIDCHWQYAFHSRNTEEPNKSCLILVRSQVVINALSMYVVCFMLISNLIADLISNFKR